MIVRNLPTQSLISRLLQVMFFLLTTPFALEKHYKYNHLQRLVYQHLGDHR